MVISDEKMNAHYEAFIKCAFHDGKFNNTNLRRAFEHVTANMLREYNSAVMKVAFDAANQISNFEFK